MSKPLRKALEKLKYRQDQFDNAKKKPGTGFKRPGSMNMHKQGGKSKRGNR